ncbi:putative toxin-antitoxin system, toxin component [delta proteobacterium NaphS2]|nr:putative toxin-antitoxin system, toxin component [delta proteobacterium NaphS2]
MEFTWHEEKRKSNIRKHGLDFARAHNVFAGETFTFEDIRFDYGEQRFVTIGLLDDSVVIIVHTETAKEIRIISMRRANKHEQKLYFENLYG